jgi:ABC-type antimicrobial peptide transport system permease subunit
LIMISVGLGVVAALEFCRILGSFVANLNASDARVFLGSTVILVAVGILATYLPARRVAHIDPSVALRYE